MPDILDELHQLIRLRGDTYSSYEVMGMVNRAADEIARLKIENWQLKGALGYPVPSHIPEGDFKCGLCDARRQALSSR